MTEFEATAKGWSGEQGYITWELISRYIPVGGDAHYYMAGPQGMTTAMHKMLSENGVSEESMTSEQFSGY
jgi:ferredoxin-NADP reductase